MKRLRIFIAIRLTPEIISNIARVQEGLKRSRTKVKWVRPENIHLTLKFLGYLTPEELERAETTTREALQPFRPFEISIAGLSAFPRIKYPRVIWIGIDKGKEELKRIASKLDMCLTKASFTSEKGEFIPHLTLGRIKSRKGRAGLIRLLANTKVPYLGSMTINKIATMESELRPRGPIYTSLDEMVLGEERIEGNSEN